MQVKIFQIGLSGEQLHRDQEALNNFLGTVTVKETSSELVNNFWSVLIFYEGEKVQAKTPVAEKVSFPADTVLSEEEKKIYVALKQWRFDKSNESRLPTYLICSNGALIAIAKVKPQNNNELQQIKGFGEQKIAKYGSDIMALLNSVA
jgi:superfamily II DNA helicase RecQ